MMNKLRNLTKSRKFYLLLCGVVVLSFFLKAQVANSVAPIGITIETFTKIDFVNDRCWQLSVNSGIVQYTNGCSNTAVVLTLLDGITQKSFLIAPQGKLIFSGGNVVHIITELP